MLRGLLIWHSSYFAAALDPASGWLQDDVHHMDLECEHATFDAFCGWLFTGRLKDPPTHVTTADDVYLPNQVLIDIWIFTELRGIPALGNAAIDMLHERVFATRQLPRSSIKPLYKGTVTGSKLRAWVVAVYKASAQVIFLTKNSKPFTKEFLCDMFTDLVKRTGYLNTIQARLAMDRCQWHDHSGPGGKLRLDGRQ